MVYVLGSSPRLLSTQTCIADDFGESCLELYGLREFVGVRYPAKEKVTSLRNSDVGTLYGLFSIFIRRRRDLFRLLGAANW